MKPEEEVSGGKSRALFCINPVSDVYDYVRGHVSPFFGCSSLDLGKGLARELKGWR